MSRFVDDRPGISLDEWYPLVLDVVPTPLTVVLEGGEHLWSDDPQEKFEKAAKTLRGMWSMVGTGYPAFLRTGLTSGKHDWRRTCFVPDAADLVSHMRAICEYSEMVDPAGGLSTEVWVLRELLNTRPAFEAFRGMPITRERRYFFEDGEVIGHHPYWPPEAISGEISSPEWRGRLHRLNHESPEEVFELTKLTEKVAAVIPGAWSVDWLWTLHGWFLTDMAWAEWSFIWKEWPSAPHAFIEAQLR